MVFRGKPPRGRRTVVSVTTARDCGKGQKRPKLLGLAPYETGAFWRSTELMDGRLRILRPGSPGQLFGLPELPQRKLGLGVLLQQVLPRLDDPEERQVDV